MIFYPRVHVEDKPTFGYCNTASAWLRERRKKHSRFHMVWASFWILIHHCWFTPSFKSALQLSECAVCLWRSTGECWFSSRLLAKSGQAGKMFLSRGPQFFWHQRPVSWKSIFPQMGMGGRIVEAVMREMGSHGKWLMSSAGLPTTHLLLWRPAPQTGVKDPGFWGLSNYQNILYTATSASTYMQFKCLNF